MKIKLLSALSLLTLGIVALIGLRTPARADTVTIKKLTFSGDPAHPKSQWIDFSAAGIGAVFVSDGVNGNAAFDFHVVAVTGRVSVNLLTSYDNANAKLYEGLLATYKVYDRGGVSGSVGIGWKGVKLDRGFEMAKQRPLLASLQITLPFNQ